MKRWCLGGIPLDSLIKTYKKMIKKNSKGCPRKMALGQFN